MFRLFLVSLGSSTLLTGELGKDFDTIVNALIKLLSDDEWIVREIAAYTLGYLGKKSNKIQSVI